MDGHTMHNKYNVVFDCGAYDGRSHNAQQIQCSI